MTTSPQFMLRFRQAPQAASLLQEWTTAAEGGEGKLVAGVPATLELVQGEEEDAYYERVRCG